MLTIQHNEFVQFYLNRVINHLFHPGESNNFRPKVLHPDAMLMIVLVVAGALLSSVSFFRFAHPLGWVLGYASNIDVGQVVASTNQERQQQGLAALVYNATLAQAAQNKANDMFANQYWSHTSPAGKDPWSFIGAAGYKYRVAGENLAKDFANTGDMVRAWMDSPTHRANIVNAKYEEIGVAVVNGVLNGVETTLVVQMFGTPTTAKPALAQAPPAQVAAPAEEKTTWPVAEQPPRAPAELAEQPAQPGPTAPPPQATPTGLSIANFEAQRLGESQQAVIVPRVQAAGSEKFRFSVYSPTQLAKAVFLSLILLLTVTLIYDLFAIGQHHSLRLVGKNLAHIIFLAAVTFMLILAKSGAVL